MTQVWPSEYPAPAKPAGPTNTLAIVSFVLAFFVSIAAIVTGHIALNQIKRTGEGGRGLAIAGLVIGYVSVVAGIVLSVVLVLMLLVAGQQSQHRGGPNGPGMSAGAAVSIVGSAAV
ncbi:DUF4190 domain-containing protein [Arthrobacter sp. 35W]|uniref:DUF4190 domain-containing protein n=1 Tax=Arthrobacter sp. 35W TaxID=1132441 RepID=UPI00042074F5|nr:DUF4190 domain-containing protein [Arthrobacter sp. 35W]